MSNPAPRTEPVSPSFPLLVQMFFTEYMVEQRALSPNTVATYRDAFVLFLSFAQSQSGKSPERMALVDITPELILAFLEHLEHERHNTVLSRNARLAALRAFLKFASHRDVSSLHAIERALSVPVKRFEHALIGFLSREEMRAIIGTPGTTWVSQRDHLLLGLLYNTAARVSEMIRITVPVPVTKTEYVGVASEKIVLATLLAGAERHAPVPGSVSQMDRTTGKVATNGTGVTSITSVPPAFTVATEKAFEPLAPGKLRMPSPVGVVAKAIISASAVIVAESTSVFNPDVIGAGSVLVQS